MNAALAFLLVLLAISALVGVVAAVLDRRRARRIEQDLREQGRRGTDD